jgi:hypothetical protein
MLVPTVQLQDGIARDIADCIVFMEDSRVVEE